MVRDLVSQIDPKKELTFWTTLISVIKRTIHGLYSRKIASTVSIIHKEIKDSIKISKSKLTLTLIDLGYTQKKPGDNRRVLCDQVSIINDMCNYLRKIKSFREAG